MIDLCLFTLCTTAAISTLLEHTAPEEAVHVRFMLHHVLRNDAKGGEVGVYLLPGK